MINIDDIIFAVFNEDELNLEEEELLAKENSDIYDFMKSRLNFSQNY